MNGRKLERELVPRDSIAWGLRQVEGNVHYASQAGRRYRVHFTGDSVDGSAMDEINVTVPDRSFFVLGDNHDRSRYSWNIGSIHVGHVIGYVGSIFWPAETWLRFGVYRD